MDRNSDRLNLIIKQRRIKLHLFEPSNRKIWTVVGTSAEYWMDPDLGFCSCPNFYFSGRYGRHQCYHLDAADLAVPENMYETVRFTDSEYESFIDSIISGM